MKGEQKNICNNCSFSWCDGLTFIQKDRKRNEIMDSVDKIISNIDGDIYAARMIVSVIKVGYRVDTCLKGIDNYEKLYKKYSEKIGEIAEIFRFEIKKYDEDSISNVRGELFEALVTKQMIKKYKIDQMAKGAAVPIKSTGFKFDLLKEGKIDCYKHTCVKIKEGNVKGIKDTYETIDCVYYNNNVLFLVEIKIKPFRFNCVNLLTMNKIRYILKNSKDYNNEIDLVLITADEEITMSRKIDKIIDEKKCSELSNELNDKLNDKLIYHLKCINWERLF